MMVSLMSFDYASTIQIKKNSVDHNYFSRQVCYVCHYGIATSKVEKSKAYKIKNKATNFLAHNGEQVADNDNRNQWSFYRKVLFYKNYGMWKCRILRCVTRLLEVELGSFKIDVQSYIKTRL